MLDPLALCKIETVQIKIGTERSHRVEHITAHRFLDFAAHRSPSDNDLFSERWNITHLPSGRLAATGFCSIESTAAAMVEIARLRNDWSCIEEADAANETAVRVAEIIRRHDERARVGQSRCGNSLGNDLNGYAGARA